MKKQLINIGYVNYPKFFEHERLFSIEMESKFSKWIMVNYSQKVTVRPDEQMIGNKKDIDINIEVNQGKIELVVVYNPKYTIVYNHDEKQSKEIMDNLPLVS